MLNRTRFPLKGVVGLTIGLGYFISPSNVKQDGFPAIQLAPSSALPPLRPPLPIQKIIPGDGTEAMDQLMKVFLLARKSQLEGTPASLSTLLDAGYSTLELYRVIFGRNSLLTSILVRVGSRHLKVLSEIYSAESTPPEACVSLRSLLAWEGRVRGREVAAGDRRSAVHTALWVTRVLDFMRTYMLIMANEPTLSPNLCARKAYDEKLSPYHGGFPSASSRLFHPAH